MELRTQTLTQAQLEQEIGSIVDFLQIRGKWDLTVSYGWGCDVDFDDLYQEKPLPLPDLRGFIMQNIRSGIFAFGEGDLYISSRDEEVEFVLCHELDVHITSEDKGLALEVASGWAERGYTYYEVVRVRSHMGEAAPDLEEGYKRMAADEEHEAEALEWSEGLIGDVAELLDVEWQEPNGET